MGSHFSSSARPDVYFSSSSVTVPVRKSKDSEEVEQTPFHALLKSKCRSLFCGFQPAWWLFNGHLQTLYCVTGDFTKTDKVVYDRKYIRLLDGGTIGLDFTPADAEAVAKETPIIVVLHGLTGGSYESYVRAVLAPACAPIETNGLGYRGVVVNFRGCAGVPLTSPQLYSAGHTDDLRQALFFISKLYPDAPLLGLGYSLGANVMTRYIAEEGEQSRLVAGCVLGCPWDLAKNNDALNSGFIGRFYSQGMGSNLLRLLKRHAKSLSRYPEHRIAPALSAALELNSPALDNFDHTFTRIAGGSSPPFPFASATDYYVWASSHKVLVDVKIPFLAVNAADDPVVQEIPKYADGNSWVVMAVTPKGGHLGWFEAEGFGSCKRWFSKPVLEWMRLVGEDIIQDGTKRKALYEENGFIKEVGTENLGCKEVHGGGLVTDVEGSDGLFQGL